MTISVQHKIEKLAESGKRSDSLIVTFKDGYVDKWYMAVKEAFRSQLDIKFTPRIDTQSQSTGKREVKLWTQGPRIAFDKGNIFYDTPYGYQVWEEAIKYIKLACVVTDSKPNDVKKIKSSNGEKAINQLINGFVKAEILIPNNDRTNLIKHDNLKLSQNEFVQFLMDGI